MCTSYTEHPIINNALIDGNKSNVILEQINVNNSPHHAGKPTDRIGCVGWSCLICLIVIGAPLVLLYPSHHLQHCAPHPTTSASFIGKLKG